MIAAGARTVVVTGMAPLGCAPYLLALFPGAPGDYDRVTGCNTRLNGLAKLHNHELKRTLDELWRAHPGRSFLYGDVYRPIASAVASPAQYGTQITAHPLSMDPRKLLTRVMDIIGLSPQVSATRRWPRAAGAAAARTTSTSQHSAARRGRRCAPTRPNPSGGMGSTSPRRRTGSWPVPYLVGSENTRWW